MPRPNLYRTSEFPYHVTVRANNRENFPVSPAVAWRFTRVSFAEAAERYGAWLHALVLMSNHLHLILSTPRQNLDQVMRYALSQIARRMNAVTERTNHIFGERYHWSVLDNAVSVAYATKYLLRNPVRAGMVSSVADYPYSTEVDVGADLPLVDGFGSLWRLVPRGEARAHWLRQPTPRELEELVAKALKRKVFAFSRHSNLQYQLQNLQGHYGVHPEPAWLRHLLVPKGV